MDLSNSVTKSSRNISVVIPVLNEVENISRLIDAFNSLPRDSLCLCIKEIVFVDDGSTDGTVNKIKSYATNCKDIDIVVKERTSKQGTVNAQIFGMSNCKYDSVIVMDGDLQHPVRYIPKLIEKYLEGYDIVLASRYVKGGNAKRKVIHGLISRGANMAAKAMLPWVRNIKDPISGFFIVNRRFVNTSTDLNGYNKLALYILSAGKRLSTAEVPFSFIERSYGKSKVSDGGINFIIKYIAELRFYRRYHTEECRKHVITKTSGDRVRG